MIQTSAALVYIHPAVVEQCSAVWSWYYGAASLARLVMIVMIIIETIKKMFLLVRK